jgi:glycosyltransferase involved in cell wall biosynthesis
VPLTVLSVSYPLARVSENTAGGAEQVLAILDEALVRCGHRSLVLAPAGSRCYGLLIPAQIPTGVLDENAKQEARRTFKQVLNRVLARYRVDVVHMHGLDFSEYLPDGDIPVVVSLHLPLSWYETEALRSSAGSYKTLVCVSKAQARSAPSGIRMDHVIPNGINLERFNPARKKGNYVVALGRICPEKGFHLTLDAAERAGVELILAGKVFAYPEHQSYFDSIIRPRLGRNARFIGAVGGARKARLLAGARCLLVPSLVPETSSLVAMEAIASGTPVIAWRSGALPEIVNDEQTGFLVSSVEQMSDSISRVESIDPSSCRVEAERRFSSEKMIADYLNLYRSILACANMQELEAA